MKKFLTLITLLTSFTYATSTSSFFRPTQRFMVFAPTPVSLHCSCESPTKRSGHHHLDPHYLAKVQDSWLRMAFDHMVLCHTVHYSATVLQYGIYIPRTLKQTKQINAILMERRALHTLYPTVLEFAYLDPQDFYADKRAKIIAYALGNALRRTDILEPEHITALKRYVEIAQLQDVKMPDGSNPVDDPLTLHTFSKHHPFGKAISVVADPRHFLPMKGIFDSIHRLFHMYGMAFVRSHFTSLGQIAAKHPRINTNVRFKPLQYKSNGTVHHLDRILSQIYNGLPLDSDSDCRAFKSIEAEAEKYIISGLHTAIPLNTGFDEFVADLKEWNRNPFIG